jgi:hypothetical protein
VDTSQMTEIQQDKSASELVVVLTILGTALVAVLTVCLIESIYYGIGKKNEV